MTVLSKYLSIEPKEVENDHIEAGPGTAGAPTPSRQAPGCPGWTNPEPQGRGGEVGVHGDIEGGWKRGDEKGFLR